MHSRKSNATYYKQNSTYNEFKKAFDKCGVARDNWKIAEAQEEVAWKEYKAKNNKCELAMYMVEEYEDRYDEYIMCL